MTDTETRVQKIVIEIFGVEPAKAAAPETNLADDLGADSMDRVDLIMVVEDEFDIAIPDDDADKVTTVGELVALVDVFLAKAPARA